MPINSSILRAFVLIAIGPLLAGPSWGQTVGLVSGSFAATYIPKDGGGCSSLLVTGQFVAPTPGYNLSIAGKNPQDNGMIYQLELSAVAPSGPVPQVLTTIPVQFADPNYSGCHYGVSIVYKDQKILVGLMPVRR